MECSNSGQSTCECQIRHGAPRQTRRLPTVSNAPQLTRTERPDKVGFETNRNYFLTGPCTVHTLFLSLSPITPIQFSEKEVNIMMIHIFGIGEPPSIAARAGLPPVLLVVVLACFLFTFACCLEGTATDLLESVDGCSVCPRVREGGLKFIHTHI